MIRLQDEWLGEILSLLQRNGRLEHTIIMVAGDHGVRSSLEDPTFQTNLLDARSFQVPFYLYAPQSFRERINLDCVTSHIDVAPSILDRLGLDKGRGLEQGTVLWDPRIKNRVTFLWGSNCLGVDGFYRKGEFFSQNVLSGDVMRGARLQYADFQAIVDTGEISASSRIGKMRALAEQWPGLDVVRSVQ
jgi:hypothetical protein